MQNVIQTLLENGMQNEVFMNAEALVAVHGKVMAHVRVGHSPTQKRFDLSSLTKPIVTMSLCFDLQNKALLRWEDSVSDFLTTKTLQHTSVKDLLEHRSGLMAYHEFLPYQLKCRQTDFWQNRQEIVKEILTQKKFLTGKPGATLYSDLGYIVLGEILQWIRCKPLDKMFRVLIANKINMRTELHFLPLPQKRILRDGYVASEVSRARARLLWGEVQDDRCYLMGGVAGHAGLFGTARAIHLFLAQWRLAEEKKSKIFAKESFLQWRLALAHPVVTRSRFVFGFDTVDADSKNFGSGFDRQNTVCHLGFSGVSFVWDLSQDAWVILLTDRCMFGGDNQKIYGFRKTFHDRVTESWGKVKRRA